jgi:hypothetical protein
LNQQNLTISSNILAQNTEQESADHSPTNFDLYTEFMILKNESAKLWLNFLSPSSNATLVFDDMAQKSSQN